MEEERFASGRIDYDLGYDRFTRAVHEFLSRDVFKNRKDLIPDEISVRVWPWYSRFVREGLAKKLSPQVLIRCLVFLIASVIALVILPFAILAVGSPPRGLLSGMPVVAWITVVICTLTAGFLHQWPIRGWWLFKLSTAGATPEAQKKILAELLGENNLLLKWFREQLRDANSSERAIRLLRRSFHDDKNG